LGNKQDVDGAMDEMELCEALSLEREINEAQTPTRIELCSALKGGFDRSIKMGFKYVAVFFSS
jgi:ADP-ribosylation factor-like protein 13B